MSRQFSYPKQGILIEHDYDFTEDLYEASPRSIRKDKYKSELAKTMFKDKKNTIIDYHLYTSSK